MKQFYETLLIKEIKELVNFGYFKYFQGNLKKDPKGQK